MTEHDILACIDVRNFLKEVSSKCISLSQDDSLPDLFTSIDSGRVLEFSSADLLSTEGLSLLDKPVCCNVVFRLTITTQNNETSQSQPQPIPHLPNDSVDETILLSQSRRIPQLANDEVECASFTKDDDTNDSDSYSMEPAESTANATPHLYVEPTLNDILLGRGGRTNHYQGNKIFREVVQHNRERYRVLGKGEKTILAQTVVRRAQELGRFLRWDGHGWIAISNKEARKKASQALRENDDSEKRAAKRARFLAKRAAARQLVMIEGGSYA